MDAPDYLRYGTSTEPDPLLAALEDSHARTLQVFTHWQSHARQMPKLAIVNPPAWEFGHVAWFQEFWVHRRGDATRPARVAQADALFNSAIVPHDTRWDLPLPSPDGLCAYLDSVYQATVQLLQQPSLDPADAYFIRLALFHQDMHNEAFAYSWQTVGWPWPEGVMREAVATGAAGAELHFADGEVEAGIRPGTGFAFDNEKWAHPVAVPAFAIAASPVTQREYLDYVQQDPQARSPRHWRSQGGQWEQRVFDRWRPLQPDAPVCHISAGEAEAYCGWRGRRLPTEFEWLRFASARPELAFSGVWEWTASVFSPFPGFQPDPYADYSQPWFDGSYRVLKGASRWTPARLHSAGFRNFYRPSRSDLFCGFRTCATNSG